MMLTVTLPRSVNLKAFESRFLRTWCNRVPSVTMERGRDESSAIAKASPFSSATARKVRSRASRTSAKATSAASTDVVPDSILERSRMSLISVSRSTPLEWIVSANCTCLGIRFPSGFSASCCARISRLFRGVRSSCDMLARNCDLYLEVSAS